jgi:hypothetical protein
MEIGDFSLKTQIITILKKQATKFALFATKFETPGSKKAPFANRSSFRADAFYAHLYTQGIVFVRDPRKPPPPKQPFFPHSPCFSPSERRSARQKGIIRPVFLPAKLAISDSRPVYTVSENMGEKVPQ